MSVVRLSGTISRGPGWSGMILLADDVRRISSTTMTIGDRLDGDGNDGASEGYNVTYCSPNRDSAFLLLLLHPLLLSLHSVYFRFYGFCIYLQWPTLTGVLGRDCCDLLRI